MSEPSFVEKDAETILGDALAVYEAETGVKLAPADPRLLHLRALTLPLAQLYQNLDFAAKQNLRRYAGKTSLPDLADLWGLTPIEAAVSTCTLRWTASSAGVWTIPAGTRATNGTDLWEVYADTDGVEGDVTSGAGATYVDTRARCTVAGKDSNGVAVGQINTIVDTGNVPGIASVSNLTETKGGADVEGTEQLRERMGDEPERDAVAGPSGAYQANAKKASSAVVDAVALGARDSAEMAGTAPDPGEVFVLIMEGTRDDDGEVATILDEPSADLIDTVTDFLTAEEVRPLTDSVTVKGPEAVEFDLEFVYYIATSQKKRAAEIQTAVEAAVAEYKLWQKVIGRDINPDRLRQLVLNAGAKRIDLVSPAFTELKRDECSILDYEAWDYGGIEDD